MKKQYVFRNDPSFSVVEEVQGKTRLFPHTAQLGKLQGLINFEFRCPLPLEVTQADHLVTGFEKFALWTAADGFCAVFNEARSDRLRLHALIDADLVPQRAMVSIKTSRLISSTTFRARS